MNSKTTLNFGLRLDVINPQTINDAGNAGFLDLNTGQIGVVGIGDIPLNGGVENKLNWAPRLGATHQITEKTVLRGGYGRVYDIGVFGSLFGHSVTQNLPVLAVQELNAPSNFDRVFTLASGPPAPAFPAVPSSGRFALPDGVFARALPAKQRPPTVDAFNVMVQHQLTPSMSIEAGYVGNRGRDVFAGDGPAINVNQASLNGFAQGVPLNNRRPFFAPFGWTQGIDYFCNCATNSVRLAAGQADQALLVGLFGQRQLHAAAGAPARRRSVRDRSARASGPLQQRSRVRPSGLGSRPQLRLLDGAGTARRKRP